jgi:hypothetical protein
MIFPSCSNNSRMIIPFILRILLLMAVLVTSPPIRSRPHFVAVVVEAFGAVGGRIASTSTTLSSSSSRRIVHSLHRRPAFRTTTSLAVQQESSSSSSSRFNVDDETKQTSDSAPSSTINKQLQQQQQQQQQQQESFDPLGLSSATAPPSLSDGAEIINVGAASASSLEHHKINGNKEEGKQQQQQQEMGIWAARGILLLVAAIWGTNFAVRMFYIFCVSCAACILSKYSTIVLYYTVSNRFVVSHSIHIDCILSLSKTTNSF